MKYYVGHKGGKMAVFQSAVTPTEKTHGHFYTLVTGPFRTLRGARFMAEHGHNNPHVRSVADAERIAETIAAKAAASPFIDEMRELLKKKGYDPHHAEALVTEGMGPEELRGRLAIRPGEVGSIEYTHRIHRAHQSNPSRERWTPPSHWRQHGGDQWGASVQYADGQKHDWGIIKEMASGRFTLEVKTPSGIFRVKRDFDTLSAAEKYANRFIERADGWEKLEAALSKDFHKVLSK